MKILKTTYFHKFAKKVKIPDNLLINAVKEIESGLIDADLGSGLIKQRIAKQGRGKSKGYRSIIVYKRAAFSLFIYGFDKKDQENLSAKDLDDLKLMAQTLLMQSEAQIEYGIRTNKFIEVIQNEIQK